jgi:hypothetical protein
MIAKIGGIKLVVSILDEEKSKVCVHIHFTSNYVVEILFQISIIQISLDFLD